MFRVIFCILLGIAPSGTSTAPADLIEVERRAATVEYVTVDPTHPPTTLPAKKPNEDAWCRFAFDCAVKLKYEVVARRSAPDGRITVDAQVQEVHVLLTLTDTIFLPEPTTEKLKAHEAGHHRINERVYDADGDAAARVAAHHILSRTWTATADTEDAAGKLATDQAVRVLGDEYLEAVADKAYAIGQTYDELTNHGKKLKPIEDDAIEQAFVHWSRRHDHE